MVNNEGEERELEEALRGVEAELSELQAHYRHVFTPGEGLDRSSRAVLLDLEVFCRGMESLYEDGGDAIKMAYLAGRRDVLLRIFQMTGLSFSQLWRVYTTRKGL